MKKGNSVLIPPSVVTVFVCFCKNILEISFFISRDQMSFLPFFWRIEKPFKAEKQNEQTKDLKNTINKRKTLETEWTNRRPEKTQ
jgi:hypothetical protein